MTSFRISAPGKVILFGEHSVVYGKAAVAASLNLHSKLRFQEQPPGQNDSHVSMPKLDLEQQVPLSLLQKHFSGADFASLSAEDHNQLHDFVRVIVEEIGVQDSQQKLSLECFFYALAQILKQEDLKLKPFDVWISTDLSIGAGTGSSASFSVCLVAAFLHWARIQKTSQPTPFDSEDLGKISKYALNCEKIMHGSPSGIDNSICTFGSAIQFQKGESPKFISLRPGSMQILLVDTKVGRSTKALVDRLAGLKTKYPAIINNILNAMDEISKEAICIFEQMTAIPFDDNEASRKVYENLSVLIDINQSLLTACRVSHSSLDLICAIAKKHGFSSKLTGAGGGGYAYVLLPPNESNSKVTDLTLELSKNNFLVRKTDLGGAGVQVHFDE